MNSTKTTSVTLGVEAIEEVEHFTYLGSVINAQGGTEADVEASIGDAMVVSPHYKFKLYPAFMDKWSNGAVKQILPKLE